MTETVISSSVLIFVVILLRTVFKGKIKNRVRYALWLVVAVRLLMPFSLIESSVSVMNFFDSIVTPEIISGSDEISETYDMPAVGNVEDFGVYVYNDVSENTVSHMPNGGDERKAQNDKNAPRNTVPAPESSAVKSSPAKKLSAPDIARIVRRSVTAAMLIWFAAVNIVFYKGLKRSRKRLEYDSPLKIYVCGKLESPCIFGIVKPSVYVTEEAAREKRALDFVVAHEVCHYYHGDIFWTVLRYVLLSVYWFDPLVWAAAVLSKRDCECACDEAVILKFGEDRRFEYGKAIVDLIPEKRSGLPGIASTSMSSSGRVLRERIKFISRIPKNIKAAVVCTVLVTAAAAGCTFTSASAAELSETETPPEAAVTSEAAEKPEEIDTRKKDIQPVSPSKRQAYFENGEFSAAAELTSLMSSLYYPDIVHDIGADPELFVATLEVKAKNMTEEIMDFDAAKLSLSDMLYCGGDTEVFKNIGSGKSAVGELRFLCSLEQAADIKGLLYDGGYFEEGEEFYPEEFNEIIDIQSADDVAEYYYRQFVVHMYSGHYALSGQPTRYEMNNIRGIKKDGKNYLAVTYTGYNRSDYAQIIDPSGFAFLCSEYKGKGETIGEQFIYDRDGSPRYVVRNDTALEPVEPLYISADEGLMYAPSKAGIELDGVGEIYELPEYICMNLENPTVFTIIYDLKNYDRVRQFIYNDSHENEPYYSSVNNSSVKDWDVWEEDYYEQ